jgi:iron complex transport system ATP-binding protein
VDRDAPAALNSASQPLLHAAAVSVCVGRRTLVADLNLALQAGEFIALLGRNGCGKSLSLLSFAGLRPVDAGSIALAGQPVSAMRRRDIARHLGLLTQDREESLPLTALESALLGRHPHLEAWQDESADDRAIAEAALVAMGVNAHAHRLLDSLSGGEQRRAAMASLLAQQPRVFLLDEPTNHLDPHHQLMVLDQFRACCGNGAAVIASLHDPSLAARYADRVLLMYGDGRWKLGPTGEILTAAELSALYLTPLRELGSGAHRAFVPS